jgi:hypothetical protein
MKKLVVVEEQVETKLAIDRRLVSIDRTAKGCGFRPHHWF